jgi:hypothetical protein
MMPKAAMTKFISKVQSYKVGLHTSTRSLALGTKESKNYQIDLNKCFNIVKLKNIKAIDYRSYFE